MCYASPVTAHNPEARRESLEKRFWARVNRTDSCWLWRGPFAKNGYGQIGSGSTVRKAHRLSWELHNGPIPPGFWVLHRCDVRECCNPDHLYLGKATENNRDSYERKRRPVGEEHPQAKLTTEQVLDIRSRYKAGEKAKTIALLYNIHVNFARAIGTGAKRKNG